MIAVGNVEKVKQMLRAFFKNIDLRIVECGRDCLHLVAVNAPVAVTVLHPYERDLLFYSPFVSKILLMTPRLIAVLINGMFCRGGKCREESVILACALGEGKKLFRTKFGTYCITTDSLEEIKKFA